MTAVILYVHARVCQLPPRQVPQSPPNRAARERGGAAAARALDGYVRDLQHDTGSAKLRVHCVITGPTGRLPRGPPDPAWTTDPITTSHAPSDSPGAP